MTTSENLQTALEAIIPKRTIKIDDLGIDDPHQENEGEVSGLMFAVGLINDMIGENKWISRPF